MPIFKLYTRPVRNSDITYSAFRSAILWLNLIVATHLAASPARDKAAIATRQIPVEHLGTNDGLSQGLIVTMAQDSDGYIWIGTKDGLNRYDGYSFKVYRYQMSDSTTLASNYVTSLYVDETNRLWVGTETEGLYLFDRATETFIHMQPSSRVRGALRGRSIGFNISGDGHGHILVPMISVQGYDVITIIPPASAGGRETYSIATIENVFPGMPASFISYTPVRLTTVSGVWDIKGDSALFFPVHGSAGYDRCTSYPLPVVDHCTDAWRLHTDPQQEEVYLIHCHEVYRFHVREKKFKHVFTLPDAYSFGNRFIIDRRGRLWNRQNDNTLLRMDISTGVIERLEPIAPASVTRYITDYAFDLQDKYGNVWMGSTGEGIIKISAGADLFKRMPEPAPGPKNIRTLWPYRTARPGVKAELDLASYDTLQRLLTKPPFSTEIQVLPDAPLILAKDLNSAYWIVSSRSSNSQLVRAEPTKGTTKVISRYGGDYENWLYLPIIPDRSGGVWYSERTLSDTVHLYHVGAGGQSVENFIFPVKNERTYRRFINDWYEEEGGTLWFATQLGVFSFHPNTKVWKRYSHERGKKGSLSFNQVLCLCPDPTEPQRYLWAGTEGGGLNRLDRTTGQSVAYTVEDGLPNNVIYAVQSDKHNNLWISTNNGLCLFDPRTLQVRTFSTVDGLPGNEFNRFQFSRSAAGILCFGGVEGTVSFDPEDFYKSSAPARMVFTMLKLSNKPVTQKGVAGIPGSYRLPCPIEQARELTFAYDQHLIGFEFALLDLSNPARNRYRYKLENLYDDWIDNGYNHEITLTNLAPGSYTLRIQGQNGNGIWSTQEAVMHIVIKHPWWSTWWFRIAVALALAGIVYAIYSYRLRQAVHMERMRNRIAQDLHDEIGSTLSSISLYSAVMQRSSPDMTQDMRDILDKMTQSTSQMMESMNDIVWTIKADNDNFEQVVDRMRAFAVNMTEPKDIALHFEADGLAERLEMGMNQRKNIYLIFKEAVNNTVKYSGCKNLYVTIYVRGGRLEMTIRDDGSGFDERADSSGQLGGNGLRGMRQRASDIGGTLSIDSAIGRGTTIALSLPV